MSEFLVQAPELHFTRHKGVEKGASYFGWPPELYKQMNKELSGKEGNCIKLINILLGTAEGFKVSQKWICEMAGLSKDGYYKARKKLQEKGILIYDELANKITIDTAGMLERYSQENKKNEGMLETYSKGISETYPQSISQTYSEGISETYYNKKETKEETEKKETEKCEAFSGKPEKSSGNPSQAKASQSTPTVSKEKREKLLRASKTEGMGEFLDDWFGKGGKVVYPNQEWKGL